MLTHVGESQGAVFGELRLHPLQYNPALRILRKYSRIIVRVGFGKTSVTRGIITDLTRALAINDQVPGPGERSASIKASGTLQRSVLASGTWYRFPITESGMYKMTGKALLDAGHH